MWQLLFRSNFYAKSEFCERKIVGTDNNFEQHNLLKLSQCICCLALLNCIQCIFKTQLICIPLLNNMWNNELWRVTSWVQSWPCLKFHFLSYNVHCMKDIGRDRARTGSDAWCSVAWSKALLTEKACDQNWLVRIIGVTNVCCQIPSYINYAGHCLMIGYYFQPDIS